MKCHDHSQCLLRKMPRNVALCPYMPRYLGSHNNNSEDDVIGYCHLADETTEGHCWINE